MTTLVCVAHPGDEVLDAGGTIAKYIRQGEKLAVVIFSYGEGSDPLKDAQETTILHIKESKKALEILGVRDTIFLSLSDNNLSSEVRQPSTAKKFGDILARYNPTKVITHASDDLHTGHRTVSDFVREHARRLKKRPEIYEFGFSLPFRMTHREKPRLYVNVGHVYDLKRKAVKMFRSQKEYYAMWVWPWVKMQNWFSGFAAKCHYAEVFYRV
ncbi:MAG: PIG-L deacetylase family protein [archaeon]